MNSTVHDSLLELHTLKTAEARRRREADVLLAAMGAVTAEAEHRHVVEAAITALKDALGAAHVLVITLDPAARKPLLAEVPGGSGLGRSLSRLLGGEGINILRNSQTRNIARIEALEDLYQLDLPVEALPAVLACSVHPNEKLALVAVGQPGLFFTSDDTALFKRFIPVLRQALSVQRLNEERERLETELRQAQRLEALGTLAGGIAHEINTPCQFVSDNLLFIKSVMSDFGRLIAEYRGADLCDSDTGTRLKNLISEIDLDFLLDETPRAIDQSLQGIGQVSRIVSAVKEFSHPGGADPLPVDINHLLENTIALCRNHWKYAAQIKLSLAQGLGPVQGYADQLSQVILNLVVNAADAIEERYRGSRLGTITISTTEADNGVEISVADDGNGIPEENLAKIFDLFFTTKPPGKGTGQGLSIVHSIITQRHNGSIRVESVAGEGTCFTLRLPYQSRPAQEDLI
jgi:signal transduction histidine kinase